MANHEPDLHNLKDNFNINIDFIELRINNINMSGQRTNGAWIERLADEDLAFVKRFVLASGSLKGIAQIYDVSYPTVRLRLDRLIEKIKIFDSVEITSEFERAIRAKYAEGVIDMATLKDLLAAHRRELEEHHDPNIDSR